MADFDTLDIFTFNNELINNVIWQYENAENLKSLIQSKEDWYDENLNKFWQGIIDDFLNINTATDWGLNLWGKILKVNRVYNVNGAATVLSTDLYRRLILGKLQLIHSDGTIPSINKYLNFIFNEYETTGVNSFAYDNLNMTIQYILQFEPSDEELALLWGREILPTPAGVQASFYIIPSYSIFGFEGSNFMPFNTAPFWDGRYL